MGARDVAGLVLALGAAWVAREDALAALVVVLVVWVSLGGL